MDSWDEVYKKYPINLMFLFGVVVIVYVAIFSLFNNSAMNTPGARPFLLVIEIFLWILFVVIVFLNLKNFQHMDFDIHAFFRRIFGGTELEVHRHRDVSSVEQCEPDTGEVFHIARNKYTYDKAQEVCESLDARLATYSEVEDSYKNGANWCNYGWSSDQLALFPIQKSMYNELKKIPGHERDCGRPGVNGGYIEDTNAEFGVNCYGKKPYATEEDKAIMKKFSFSTAFPDTELNKAKKKAVADKLMVAPFNKDKWNA